MWPLPMSVLDFIERPGEMTAFVAVTPTGQVIGHVSVCRGLEAPEDDEEAELGIMWSKAHGCAIDDLRIIGVLFADPAFGGQGVGSALFTAATEEARKDGGKPSLDCLSVNSGPLAWYQRRGWRIVHEWKDCPWIPGQKLLVYLLILDDKGGENGRISSR
jgi:GNAT superfamily N-acetyltransferase